MLVRMRYVQFTYFMKRVHSVLTASVFHGLAANFGLCACAQNSAVSRAMKLGPVVILLAQTRRDRKETRARHSVSALGKKHTLEFVFFERSAMLFFFNLQNGRTNTR